jgi:general secretion pathway protein G
MNKGVCMKVKKNNKGFTLIEIMVVVIILGILTAIVAPNIIGRVGDAQITAAKQTIRSIESALRMYRLDNFNYPSTEQGIEALTNKPSGQNARNWKGPYLDRVPDDPWGNKYLYMFPGLNGEFDVYTFGRDGNQGGDGDDADIGNWMTN